MQLSPTKYSEQQINQIFESAQKLSDEKEYIKAEKAYQIVLKTLPNHPHVLSAYGKHNVNQKNFVVAEKYINQALKLAPNDIYVLLDLAAFYGDSEDYKNYVKTLKGILEIAPTNTYALVNFVYYLLINRDYYEVEKLYRNHSQHKLSITDSETLKIAFAVVAHLKNDIAQLEKLLSEINYYASEQARTDEKEFSRRRSFRVYHAYASLLLKWRKSHPEYYPTTPSQKIYVIGDSHSFGAANSGCAEFVLKTKLIMDCSAWQLASSGKKLKKQLLKNALKEVERGTKVVLSFGEIDCRANLGIHKHKLKNPQKNLVASIADLVKDYIGLASKYAKNFELDLHLLNCPAPKKSSIYNQISGEENIANYMQIIAEFNSQLAQQAGAANIKIVDIYAATHQANGWSNEDLYLDNVHFKPNVLVDLLNN